MENKPENLLVVPLGKALSGIPPSWYQARREGGQKGSLSGDTGEPGVQNCQV